jgi:hypothetical protein
LLRSNAQVHLVNSKDSTGQIYWDIEKYLLQFNETTVSYNYNVPPSPLEETKESPLAKVDIWNILGWVMLIAGGAAIIIGSARWTKTPNNPTPMPDK